MVFSKSDYQRDCEAVEKYCELILKFINALASYRLYNEKDPKDTFSIEPTEEMKKKKIELDNQISLLIESIKKL